MDSGQLLMWPASLKSCWLLTCAGEVSSRPASTATRRTGTTARRRQRAALSRYGSDSSDDDYESSSEEEQEEVEEDDEVSNMTRVNLVLSW